MKKALCVGINNYPGFFNDLKGCVNDANDWATVLQHAGFTVEKLLDDDAKKGPILTKLEKLLTDAAIDDDIVFTYSGHGTSVADKSGDEIDSYDEALVVYDGNILDDELRAVLGKTPAGVHVVVISDSCFSGTVTRIANATNARPRFLITDTIPETATLKKRFLADEEMVEILLSGCSDSEYSYDAEINGRWNGAMSAYAISVLRSGQTYAEFHKKLRALLPSADYPQTPQLEGSEANKNRHVFATNNEPLPHPDPVSSGGLWAWVKKYWWVILLVIAAGLVLWRLL